MAKKKTIAPDNLARAMQRASVLGPAKLANPRRWAAAAGLPETTVRDAWKGCHTQLDTMTAIAKAADMSLGELLMLADDDWEVKATLLQVISDASIEELKAVALLLRKRADPPAQPE